MNPPARDPAAVGGSQPKSRWSWTIGRLFGIEVSVHATFLFLLIWVAWTHLAMGGVPMAIHGLALVVAVFGIIVVHELSHALVARRFGISTRGITLLPIGGVAQLERMPEKPSQELLVAFAGPAVNVVLALVFWVLMVLTKKPVAMTDFNLGGTSLLAKLLVINLSLAAFNLIPAFPMDGGRVLRALLAFRMPYARATFVAARVGQGMALLFGIAGLLWNPMLILIAAFVWMGAQSESVAVQVRSALSGLPVGNAMITDFKTLAPGDPLSRAAELLIAGSQQTFPVVENGATMGVVGVTDIVKGLSEGGQAVEVGKVMRRDFATADPAEGLDDVVRRLQDAGRGPVLVLDGGHLVGMITAENIGEIVMLRTALESRRPDG